MKKERTGRAQEVPVETTGLAYEMPVETTGLAYEVPVERTGYAQELPVTDWVGGSSLRMLSLQVNGREVYDIAERTYNIGGFSSRH